MSGKIHVIHVKPSEHAEVIDIDAVPESFQRLLGGSIETVPCPWPGLVIYVNGSARVNRLPFNQQIGAHQVFGPFVVAKVDARGYLADLSHGEAARAASDLRLWHVLRELSSDLEIRADESLAAVAQGLREAARMVRSRL